MKKELLKEALASDLSTSHDLEETVNLLLEHRKTGFSNLQYDIKNDGNGGRTVTIHFPSPSEVAKMQAQDPVSATPPEPPVAARNKGNIVVKVAMDNSPEFTEESPTAKITKKYPRKYLEENGFATEE